MEMKVMGKGINIKVSRDRLLTALTDKINEIKNNQEKYLEEVSQYETDVKWHEGLLKQHALDNPHLIDEVNLSKYRSTDDKWVMELVYVIPKSKTPDAPIEPNPPYKGGRGYGRNYVSNDYDDIVADLTNAIRLLEMSDEDTVSTATYASVSRFL
jgi:hypothetical protein